MGALVSIATGLFLGHAAALFGVRLPGASMACAVTLAVGALVAASARGAPVRPRRAAWPLFAVLAALVGQALAPRSPPHAALPRGVARLEAEVVSSRAGVAVLRVRAGAWLESERALPRGVLVGLRGLDAAPGTVLRGLARLRPAARFDNPSPHPPWPSPHRVAMWGRVAGPVERLGPPSAWSEARHRARATIRAALEQTLSRRAAAVARTLILGDAGAIDDASRDAVRGAGLSHVLAVSGLHVALIAGGVLWLVGWLWARAPRLARRVPTRVASRVAGAATALAYAALVADSPSAWRAAVTAALAWGLVALGRRPGAAAVTAAAVLVLAVTRSDDLARPGFALSVVATAAIVTARLDDGAAKAALTVAARTMIATAPITAWTFGSVPLVGLLANVVVVPLAGFCLLPLVAAHTVVALIAPPIARVSAFAVEPVVSAFLELAALFESVPVGRDLPPLDVPQGVALAVVCLTLLAARTWRARGAVVLLGVLAIAGLEVRLRHVEQPRGEARITFLDVGQGDAALVDLPDGRLMVVDAGGSPNGGPDPGARALVPLLRARRRDRVDVLVISHPHPDHYGGVAALLDAVPVTEVWVSGQALLEEPEGVMAQLLRRAVRSGARVLRPPRLCGATRRFGRGSVRVHHPCPRVDSGWGPNENSLVVELRVGRRRVLFAGDAEAHAEASLVAAGVEPVDVLKVAHHGSRTSSSPALLEALRPRVAIVSAGRGNRFGHPHPEVAARLSQRVPCVRRTDLHGGVVVRTDGRALRVEGCAASALASSHKLSRRRRSR